MQVSQPFIQERSHESHALVPMFPALELPFTNDGHLYSRPLSYKVWPLLATSKQWLLLCSVTYKKTEVRPWIFMDHPE